MKYKNHCSRCGFCCLASTCPLGMLFFGGSDPGSRCPGLSIDGGVASCALVGQGLVPVGDGCCIKARCYRGGVEYDYASLKDETKKKVVARILSRDL